MQFRIKKSFIIRHDVDLDLLPAQKMSYLEKDMDIKSTFFIMVSSINYNIHTFKNKKILLDILSQGHEIGLHFDSSIYRSNFNQALRNEAGILQNLIGKKVYSFSLHNPSINKKYLKINSLNNAYNKKFFEKNYYFSDSRMFFKNKDPFKFIEKIKMSSLQILLHPLHYFSQGSSYKYIFKDYFKRKLSDTYSEFRVNKTFRNQVSLNFKNLININK